MTILVPFLSWAQTGPAGVGSPTNNGVWLRAADVAVPHNSPIASWLDASGNANNGVQTDATKQPIFIDNSSMNGQPVVRLDGVDDLVEIRDHNLLDGSNGQTFFVVLRPNNLDNSSALGILGKRITFTVSNDYAYTWFFWGNNRLYADFNTQNDRFNTSNSFSNATNYILALDYDGSLPANQRVNMYNAGEVIRTAGESSTSLINSNQDLVLGALNKNYRTYLSADYAEVIQYNFSLNDAQHLIVHNYLSAKYNIPLGRDLYDEDDAANGNYDHEVAGIGFLNANNAHLRARGTGIVEVSNPSNMNSDKFLLWGHDNGSLAFGAQANLPATVQQRLGRVWRASEVTSAGIPTDVGTVTLRWDLSGQPSVDAADLRLLIDTNNDGSFADETPISGGVALGGDVYEFAAVSGISNNVRFTLGSTQPVILPVELVQFEAIAQSRQVLLQWATATELNSAYFEVQRSADALSWATIDQVAAAGHSTTLLGYESVDETPLTGWSYYRLKQVDEDGSVDYSPVRAVELVAAAIPVRVYPNPTSDYVYIEGHALGEVPVRLYSSSGAEVTARIAITTENSDRMRLDLSALPAGVYLLQTPTNVRAIQKR